MTKQLPCAIYICYIFGIFFGLILMFAPFIGFEGYDSPSLSQIFCSKGGTCHHILLSIQYILDFIFGLLIFLTCSCIFIYELFETTWIKELGRYLTSPLKMMVYPTGIYHIIDIILRI